MRAERVERPVRPRSFGFVDAPEAVDFSDDGDIKRKDGNKNVQELSSIEEETILGQSFLVEGILC